MARDEPSAQPWLLLIHSIPPKPDYLRVKIGRRLARVGAVAIKNAVYVLPATDQAMEDFQWVRREIVDGGGEATISRTTFVEGLTDGDIARLFRDARSREYDEIAEEARNTLERLPAGLRPSPQERAPAQDTLAKLRKRFAAVTAIDYLGAPNRRDTSALLDAIESRLRPTPEDTAAGVRPAGARSGASGPQLRGRTWVTRQGIFVDRIASAWLIRRFIDPDARFTFVAPQGYVPAPGELRFDMFQAEYTHEGDRCTFETLLRRFALDDPALVPIAEIVHDIDLKDDKFGREDALGIERVLAAIAAAHADDPTRLERGAALFDDLYALMAKELGRAPSPHPATREAHGA
jgi:hypothetical protein